MLNMATSLKLVLLQARDGPGRRVQPGGRARRIPPRLPLTPPSD